MDTLILVLIFISLVFGAYRLKKHSDKVREEMMNELNDIDGDWEDQEADVHPEK